MKLSNLRIKDAQALRAPRILKEDYPATGKSDATVEEGRNTIVNIISGKDSRMLALVGPCSIHNPHEAREYARRFRLLHTELSDQLFLVMRTYFEKPRTRLGWQGLIVDPHLNGNYDMDRGIAMVRELLLYITSLGVPAGSELLDPFVPQYIDDLISWASIGARTTESQVHRDMASGLSMPVGMKNATSGDVGAAVNAMVSATRGKGFLGITQEGQIAMLRTKGNTDVHLVLRGGAKSPNFFPADVISAGQLLREAQLPEAILIDCSHGNSQKDYRRQKQVLESVISQRLAGTRSIIGFMLESNLQEGHQELDALPLEEGKSVTDACVGWDETVSLLQSAYDALTRRTP